MMATNADDNLEENKRVAPVPEATASGNPFI